MIYTDQQLIEKMIIDFEDEVVEFKEARTNYSFKNIGKYFSALGNEANIRGYKEALNNCIAHSNYQLRGKINLEEFEDRLVFMNEGDFIPETVEKTLEEGYKQPYYRNTFLCRAMVNLYMIDTNSMGIPMMYQIQKDKCFPLPTYDLNEPNRVKVTL